MLQTWRSKESFASIHVGIERRPRGSGLSVAVDAPLTCEESPPFERFFYCYRSGDVRGMATLDAESTAHVTAALLKDLDHDFAADRPRILEIEFDKWRSPAPRR